MDGQICRTCPFCAHFAHDKLSSLTRSHWIHCRGASDSLFGMSVIFACIVMYDAQVCILMKTVAVTAADMAQTRTGMSSRVAFTRSINSQKEYCR